MSVRAGVVQFDFSPVLKLCLFDGSSEDRAGFLISLRVSVPLLESSRSTLQLSADVTCNPWLLAGVCTYGHCGDDVIDAIIDEVND